MNEKEFEEKMVKAAKKVAVGTTKAVGMAVGVAALFVLPFLGARIIGWVASQDYPLE
jgi:hypothetical protein|tara:strand:- start:593 stop:763 length:171 start_codon:yes stop_codon:yes gene_type:complete